MNNADMPAMPVHIDRNGWKLRWSEDVGTAKKGQEVGAEVGRGYRQFKFMGKRYSTHRVVFSMCYGFLPEQVDHIDGNPRNNDPSNLRAASHSQNMINRKLHKNNNAGRTGVDYMKRENRWRAQIHKGGKKIYLGVFKNFYDAVEAREKAEKEIHGEYTRKR